MSAHEAIRVVFDCKHDALTDGLRERHSLLSASWLAQPDAL